MRKTSVCVCVLLMHLKIIIKNNNKKFKKLKKKHLFIPSSLIILVQKVLLT